MKNGRDPFFDVVKAVAIFLVLLGHVQGLASGVAFPTWCDNFRIGMNMPIFFIVSGYFAWPTIEQCNWSKLMSNVRSYFQPALFAGLVFMPFELTLGFTNPSVKAIIERILRFVFVDPWFITILAVCYVLVFVSYAVGRRCKFGWFIAAVVWLSVVCRPSGLPGTMSFGNFVSMLPHFAFGAIVLRRYNCRMWECWRYGGVCFAMFLMVVIFEGDIRTNGMSFYTADSSVHAFMTLHSAVAFVLRPVVGIVGSIGVMWLLHVALVLLPRLFVLSKIGTLTLGVYIFHLWPLERMRGIAWIGNNFFSVLLTSFVLLAFFSFITWLSRAKIGRFKRLIWGGKS